MVTFLNKYMGNSKNLSDQQVASMTHVFQTTVELIYSAIGTQAFRPVRALNAAVFDSVMVGTAKRLEGGPVLDATSFSNAYHALLMNQDYLDACGRGTAGAERVRKRLDSAKAAFVSVL